jgi:CubicO group peptidase (beta-lactamase class C family)
MATDYNQGIPQSFWKGKWFGSNWGLGWNVRAGKQDDMGILRSDSAYDHAGYGGARLLVDPEWDLVVAFYMVDQLDDDYILHAKTTNIIYSALG